MCTNETVSNKYVKGGNAKYRQHDTIQPDIHYIHVWHCYRPNNPKLPTTKHLQMLSKL